MLVSLVLILSGVSCLDLLSGASCFVLLRGARCLDISCGASCHCNLSGGESCAMSDILPATTCVKRSRVQCQLVPSCVEPKRDLASPLDRRVTHLVAHRMYRRSSRDEMRKTTIPAKMEFPTNATIRALQKDMEPPKDYPYKDRLPCYICGALTSRACRCGWEFADSTNSEALASFVRFVRAPTTPVYTEDEPEDTQTHLLLNCPFRFI